MEKGKRTIAKILIVLISFFCVDGGRSLLLINDNIQIILNQDHKTDLEVPYQHHPVSFNDEEKWIESFRYDFASFNHNPVKPSYNLSAPSQEFSDSIWQPPKFT